jgi:hypothetical protein
VKNKRMLGNSSQSPKTDHTTKNKNLTPRQAAIKKAFTLQVFFFYPYRPDALFCAHSNA